MTERYELLVRGGRVVDPRNGLDARRDLGLAGGQVVAVAETLDPGRAERVLDATNRVIFPGVIDCHVHLGRWAGGAVGHRMLARAGTVTAVDFSGPIAETWASVLEGGGAGLNLAAIEAVVPGGNVADDNPARSALASMLERALEAGAIGLKIFGGHGPMTPRATEDVVDLCHQAGAYVGFHAGTTDNGSNFHGFQDALKIIGGRPCHLAHVNAYTRGWATGDPYEENRRLLEELSAAENVVSESHLAIWNGTLGHCRDGVPRDAITRRCLEVLGYPPTEEALWRAMRDGRCRVSVTRGGENVLVEHAEALAAWGAADGHVTVAFPVNLPLSLMATVTARRPDNRFLVDALASDGGGIPRNNLVTGGLALVRLGALSLSELATKIAWAPALMLGLPANGHLGIGADADVTVLDDALGRTTHAIAAGRLIMVDGEPIATGATAFTTRAGRAAAQALGLPTRVVDEGPWEKYRRPQPAQDPASAPTAERERPTSPPS